MPDHYPTGDEDSLLELTGRSVSDRLQEADDLLAENDPVNSLPIEEIPFGVWHFWKS